MTDLYFNVTIKKNKWLELSFFNHIRDIIHSMYYVGQSESRIFFKWINLKCKYVFRLGLHTSIYHRKNLKKY